MFCFIVVRGSVLRSVSCAEAGQEQSEKPAGQHLPASKPDIASLPGEHSCHFTRLLFQFDNPSGQCDSTAESLNRYGVVYC